MANSKVILDDEVLIDLTSDTIVPSAFTIGVTATAANGEKITGSIKADNTIQLITKTLSSFYENSTVTAVGPYAFHRYASLTAVSMPNCLSIGKNAFYSCSNLRSISFPNVTQIGHQAFAACRYLSDITTFSNVTFIDSYAFLSDYSITAAIFPKVVSMSGGAFSYCTNLSIASFPLLTEIPEYAFMGCSGLTTVSFPAVTTIKNGGLRNCSLLSYAYFPSLISIGQSAFVGNGFYSISVPLLQTLSSDCFAACELTSIYLSNVTAIPYGGFYNCQKLDTAIFPIVSYINANAFYMCYRLISLYLLGSVVVSVTGDPYGQTPISSYSTIAGRYGSVFVRASLVTAYQSAKYWSGISSKIVGLTDDQISDLLG